MRRADLYNALLVGVCLAAGPSAQAQQVLTYSSGTGFFISRDGGYVITNNHVISHCGTVSLSGAVPLSKAKIIAQDVEYDLALLKTDAMAIDEARLSSAKQPLRAHDPVVVVGYPGQSWETGRTKTRTSHIISTKGPDINGKGGDERWLEFADALALGNSGGPLLDGAGNVVGVVAAKGKMVRYNLTNATNETIEQFDLAISLPVLRGFLERYHVRYQEADSGIMLSTDSITDVAHRFVVNVRCKVAS